MIRHSRIVVTALAVCSLFGSLTLPVSAAQDATPAAECVATTPEENTALALAYWDEGVWGPQGAIADIVAPDEVHSWGIGGTTEGYEAFAERWATFNTAFPDLTINVDAVTATDDTAATAWTATGTQAGEWQGIAPTGKTVSWTGINVFRIACGQVAESWGQADHLGLRAALGATDVPTLPMADAAAATPEASAAATCASPGPDANLATVERWTTDVWNKHDLAALDEIVAPEIVHHGAAFPDAVGLEALKGALTRQFEAFPEFDLAVDEAFATDDVAVVRWSGTGTHGGDFLGEPATGATVNFTGINLYRLSCGQVIESWSEMNTLDVLQEIREAAAGDATPGA